MCVVRYTIVAWTKLMICILEIFASVNDVSDEDDNDEYFLVMIAFIESFNISYGTDNLYIFFISRSTIRDVFSIL